MERVIADIQVYGNALIDEMCLIKDRHRDVLSRTEINSIKLHRNLRLRVSMLKTNISEQRS